MRNYFESAAELISTLINNHREIISLTIINYSHLNDILVNSFIVPKTSDFGFWMLKLMEHVIILTDTPYKFFQLTADLLPKAKEYRCKYYWEFFAFLSKNVQDKKDFEYLFGELIIEVFNRFETSSMHQDTILYGCIKVLSSG